MVKFYITITLFFICSFINAQTTDTLSDDNMITYIEEAPVFKGDLKDFVKNQVNYPNNAINNSIEGKVIVSFWVDTVGLSIDHIIVRGIREDLDIEALRVAKLIKFEKPAMQRGKPIKVRYTVPVEFKLSDKSE